MGFSYVAGRVVMGWGFCRGYVGSGIFWGRRLLVRFGGVLKFFFF